MQRVALVVAVLAAFLSGPVRAGEFEQEFAREVESLNPFGVRGLPYAYVQSAQAEERRKAIDLGLRWLTAHQAPDGSWRPHELFWCQGKKHPEGGPTGKGKALWDVGLTGMSVAAYLGAGYTHRGDHPHEQAVRRALTWLVAQQDKVGCMGPRHTSQYLYNHAFATLALVEAYALTGDAKLRVPAQRALDFSALSRNPGAAWRYGVRPGDNDTSITGCVGFPYYTALRLNQAGEQAGLFEPLSLDSDAFTGIRWWVDMVTDTYTGRAGYVTRGTGPARPAELVDAFPGQNSEACTAIAVLMRLALPGGDVTPDQAKHNQAVIKKGVALMLGLKPRWAKKSGFIDLYYWYYASMAMRLVGGNAWKSWDKALAKAVLAEQCKDGDVSGTFGSWDPDAVWAIADGGRIYATAITLLTLEVPDRIQALPSDRSDLLVALGSPALSPRRRASVLRGIGRMKVPRGAEAVAGWLEDEAALIRAAAAEALGRLEIGSAESHALAQSLRDPDRTVRLATVRAFARQGTRTKSVIGALTVCLQDKDPEVAAAAARALGATGDVSVSDALRTCVRADTLDLRVAAAAAVYELTGETLGAVPILLEGLTSPSPRVRVDAARALEEIKPTDPHAGQALRKALLDKSHMVRLHAAGALYAIGQSKDICIDAWISVLDAPDTHARLGAMQRLQQAPSSRAAKKLGAQLLEGSTILRVQAAATLAATGTGARSEAAALAWCTKNGSMALREAAGTALRALQLDVPSARAHLIPIFTAKDAKRQDRRLHEGAVDALALLGEPIVPALIAELRLGSNKVKEWTLLVLRKLGPKASTAVRDIAAVMSIGTIRVKRASADTLASIGPGAVDALPELKALLDHKDAALALVAVDALICIASGSDDAMRLLMELVQRTGKKAKPLRSAAVAGMGSLGERSEQVIPFLFTIVTGRDKDLRQSAVAAVASLWPKSEGRVGEALAKGNNRERRAAAEVVVLVGADAHTMLKPLLKALDAGSYGADQTYGNALAAIGKPAVSQLIKRLRNKRSAIRGESARILGLIGPAAKKALKRLKKLLKDRKEDPGVKYRAKTAIEQIEGGR